MKKHVHVDEDRRYQPMKDEAVNEDFARGQKTITDQLTAYEGPRTVGIEDAMPDTTRDKMKGM